jgi:DNA-binding response OmpR family regulator
VDVPGGTVAAWQGDHVHLPGLHPQAPLPSDPGAVPRRVKYILIAEDDADVAELLRQVLTEHLEVATQNIANGALVMDALVARRPDLLILDIGMPGLNGLDVFDLVRSDRYWQGVPILFLTALPERASTANALTGIHEILAKPFDINTLLAMADRLLAGKRPEIAA